MSVELNQLVKKFIKVYGGELKRINGRQNWVDTQKDGKVYHVNTVFIRRMLMNANSLLKINKKEETHEEPKQPEIPVSGRVKPEQPRVEAEKPRVAEVVTEGIRVEEVKKKKASGKKKTIVEVAVETEQGQKTLKEE
jgi:hypothetical protein